MPTIPQLSQVQSISYYFTPIVSPLHGGLYPCCPRIHSFNNNEFALISTTSLPPCRNLSQSTCNNATDIQPIGTRPVRDERVTQIAFQKPLNGRKRSTEAVVVDCHVVVDFHWSKLTSSSINHLDIWNRPRRRRCQHHTTVEVSSSMNNDQVPSVGGVGQMKVASCSQP